MCVGHNPRGLAMESGSHQPTDALSGRKFGKLPLKRSLKRQHDIIFRQSCFDQALGDTFFGTVVLNPYLAVLNVDMHQTTMNPLVPIPPHAHQLIVVVNGVDNLLNLHLPI